MNFEDMNLNKKDKWFLLAICIFSLILITYYIIFNVNLGIYCSDVYIYLLNALYFTGTNIDATGNIHLSPIICFLTSLLFELGLVDRLAIYIVTGLFAFLGNIGIYILFRNKFNQLYSLTGTIMFSTFSINLLWLANGSLDIPAISLTIWTVLFAMIAIDKNPKFYIILFPVFLLGFFTRYTVGLILPVLLLYYVLQKGFKIDKNELKYMLIGIAIALIIGAIILTSIIYLSNDMSPFINQASGGISGTLGSSQDPGYNPNSLFYIENFLNFISSSHTNFDGSTPVLENPTLLSIIPIIIILLGILITIKDNYKNKIRNNKILASIIIIGVLSIIIFDQITPIITIILILFCLLLAGKLTENHKELMMLGWILSYLIFFSYLEIKVDRYIITLIPAFIYFILFYLSKIQSKISIKENIIPIILIILFIGQGFAFAYTVEDTDEFRNHQIMADYVINNVEDYENQSIGVCNLRAYSWYLTKYLGAIDSSETSLIESSGMDYYISDKQLNLTNYTEIKNIDNLYLYKKIS